jgi:galactonate dehydratase
VEAGDIDLLTFLKDKSVFDIEDGNVKAPTWVGIEIDEDVIRKIAKETDPWKCKEFHRSDGSIKEW